MERVCVRGGVIGETGTAALAESSAVIVKRQGAVSGRVPEDWRERFIRAYDVELQEWLDDCAKGTCGGPSSCDGYAATVVADAGLLALRSGGGRPSRSARSRTSTRLEPPHTVRQQIRSPRPTRIAGQRRRLARRTRRRQAAHQTGWRAVSLAGQS